MQIVAALYHFTRFEDPASLRGPLLGLCRDLGIVGTLLLAREGINGTVSGTRDAIDTLLGHLVALPGCAELEWKESTAATPPFLRMKVRVRAEIVTLGRPEADPTVIVGQHVAPQDWNALISAPDVAVIDTRNDYEVAIGTFRGAINPQTQSFGAFPTWWEEHRADFAGKRIAMFCTGGIRCEKSTSFLKSQGIDEVYHLKGGILSYLEHVPADQSLWDGECFVFDGRVSVGHGLVPGANVLCHACGHPLAPDEQKDPRFEEGVACPHCVDHTTPDHKAGLRERQRQIHLARARGQRHLGAG